MFTRILTAMILIPLVVAGIYYTPLWLFAIITGGIILLAAWEWSTLMQLERFIHKCLYLVSVFLAMVLSLWIPIVIFFIGALLWWIVALIWIIRYNKNPKHYSHHKLLEGIMGWVVLIPCWIGLNVIRSIEDLGQFLVLYLLVLIWSADTSAYFIGKRFGRIKLAPQVSPKKTKAGVYAAVLSALAVALGGWIILTMGGYFSEFSLFALAWFLLSLVTVLASIVGDLFISVMKRRIALKDTGTLLPGHGGLLDRIDSLLAATPVFVLGFIYLGFYRG